MKSLAEDMFPDQSQGKPLIEQMIEKGKNWWLIDQFLPETADSLKTGFTQKQLELVCVERRAGMEFFPGSESLLSDPDLIKNYIGDAPSTQGMPDASPGNIGQWVGWRIVQKYVSLHPDITALQLMQTPNRSIFDEAKYKPR